MSRQKAIKIDQLGKELGKILDDYSQQIDKSSTSVVKDAGDFCVDAVKRNIQAAGIGGSGDYRDSIERRLTTRKKVKYATVWSPAHYRLTHLLEFGHAIVNQHGYHGRTRPFPHWAKAEEEAEEYMVKNMRRAIEKEG